MVHGSIVAPGCGAESRGQHRIAEGQLPCAPSCLVAGVRAGFWRADLNKELTGEPAGHGRDEEAAILRLDRGVTKGSANDQVIVSPDALARRLIAVPPRGWRVAGPYGGRI